MLVMSVVSVVSGFCSRPALLISQGGDDIQPGSVTGGQDGYRYRGQEQAGEEHRQSRPGGRPGGGVQYRQYGRRRADDTAA